MTLKELNSLHYLATEIVRYNRHIDTLEKVYDIKNVPAGMVLEYKAALDDLRKTMIDNRNTRNRELERIQTFIDNIEDPFTQAIFIERFENNQGWWDVVDNLMDEFGLYTTAALRQRVCRYLELYNNAAADPAAATPSVDNHR